MGKSRQKARGHTIARKIQDAIAATPGAALDIFRYLDDREIEHSGILSQATLARTVGRSDRCWRQWVAGKAAMPVGYVRLLELITGLQFEGGAHDT